MEAKREINFDEYREGSESDLSKYVQETAQEGSPESVIRAIDKFTWEKCWMLHTGDKNGEILDEAVKSANPRVILELGTYCGYSAVRMARFLPLDGKLFTVDKKAHVAAKEIIAFSGLQPKVTFFSGDSEEQLRKIKKEHPDFQADFVFFDHHRTVYLRDIHVIEELGLLKPGGTIVADNIVYFKIHDFKEYIETCGRYSDVKLIKGEIGYDKEHREDAYLVAKYTPHKFE